MSTKKVLSPKNSRPTIQISDGLQAILVKKHCGAFLVRGDRDILLDQIKATHTYQETFWNEASTLGIDDVRRQISQTDFNTEDSRLVVFSFYHITLEAQNSLLKFLEEPPKNTTIILLTSTSTVLLPTVLSRVSVCETVDQSEALEEVTTFLHTEPVLRMNLPFVKKMLLAKTEDSDAIDKEKIHNFLDQVIKLYTKEGVVGLTALERDGLSNTISLISRIKQNGSSAKQILEYSALALGKR